MHLRDSIVCLLIAAVQVQGAIIGRDRKNASTKTPWELLDALGGTSEMRGFNGTWITDQEFYYSAPDRSIRIYNAESKTDEEFLANKYLEKYIGGTFTFSPDNTKILFRYNPHQIFRHSLVAKYDVFDITTGKSFSIQGGENLQACFWSPLTGRLSYVYNNNVFIHYEDSVEIPLTSEGVNGVIYNGVPDWVYEEEVLSSGSAMWWSPDGSKLAVGFFNDTNVKSYKYFLYGDGENPVYQYPKEVDLKYPKPGTPNPYVALKVFDVNSRDTKFIEITAPLDIVSKDHILQNVAWIDNNTLLVIWLNRRQNIGSIQSCTYEGVCREVKRLTEPNGWITIGTPNCLRTGKNCLLTYWIGNWYQVWNLELKTGNNLWNSRGDFTVLKVYGYDEANDDIFYQATARGDPSLYHVFRNNDCLTCNLKDISGDVCRQASASFSKNYSYYSVLCSGPNPSNVKVFQTKNNTEIITWETNFAFREILSGKQKPTIKFLNVTLGDGSTGYARLALPPSLDWDNPNDHKKYPMIVYVYGGPNSVRVTNTFTLGFEAYLTTTRNIIYAEIDGRGTGNKGKDLLFSVNNNLGQHEVEDQIAVTNFLQKTYKFIDAERTGIWGWSYGGYVTAKTLSNDNERVFQCGISVAPVTSWLFYDTIYTERYMGLPTVEDNLKSYIDSSVMEHIENFRSHDFLLIHGSGDDNVHYQQSLMLAKELQKNDILFEEMTYTDENHSIGNFLSHLYQTMDHFWINCLNLEVDDE